MKYYAVIVGGGSGSRMQTTTPKQFLLLDGKPILMHTISNFYLSKLKPEIILVLNSDFHQYWANLCKEYHFNIPHILVNGGLQRFHSVRNGIAYIKEKAVIAIHDAVRPLASDELITRSFLAAKEFGNAIAAIKSKDSVRQSDGKTSKALNRDEIFLVQTPQAFSSEILHKAYQQEFRNDFTDDASVVERLGVKINIIEGEHQNIKITFPEDIQIAHFYLEKNK